MNSVSRLISTFVPNHYALSVKLDRINRLFHGTVTLNGTTPVDTNELRVHAKDLTILSVVVDGKSADYWHDINDELIITHPDLFAGSHVAVIEYSGKITDDMNGIYPCYYEVAGEKQEVLATQFESHYARRAFPCIDEPEAKATFDVTLQSEQGVTVLGNMPVLNQTVENDLLVTTFETTPRMSTYLLAWVVGDLQKKTTHSNNGVEVNVWATKAQPAESLDFALDIAARTIDFFDDYFGVPYPLPKSDHVALPDFSAGAMENWGLITYREIALLVEPGVTTLSVKQYVATVIAHELSHQWFGNLVTMEWWNDLWLNESFATMMEYVAIDAIEPEWQIWLEHASSESVSALRRDSIDGVQAIQADVNHPDEISTMFDPSIVYAKGGRLLRMLQAYLGDEVMRTGLKHYFEQYRYQNTSADDLWGVLGAASGKDVAGFMHAWMTQPGFPVVNVSRSDDTITLTQEQFFVGPHKEQGRLWPIPLGGVSPQIPAILEDISITFPYTDTAPFQLNLEGTAHFITQYDDASLIQLLDTSKQLSTVDKLELLHEQTLLAKAERIPTAHLIPLLRHFTEEESEPVWGMLSLIINELKKFVELNTDAEQKLRSLVAEVVETQYKRLGWNEKPGEPENDTKLRSLIVSLALYGEIESAQNEAALLYHSTPLVELNAELRGAVLACAVREELTPETFTSLLAAYEASTNSEVQDDIAGALTATKSTERIETLITILDNTAFIRPQDFTHWFARLLRSRYARSATWAWTQSHWDWLTKTFKADSSYDMFPRYIASSLVTRIQLDEYEKFFEPLKVDRTLQRNIIIGATELAGNVELLERQTEQVHAALFDQ